MRNREAGDVDGTERHTERHADIHIIYQKPKREKSTTRTKQHMHTCIYAYIHGWGGEGKTNSQKTDKEESSRVCSNNKGAKKNLDKRGNVFW